jgi:uncharacterized membrane protein
MTVSARHIATTAMLLTLAALSTIWTSSVAVLLVGDPGRIGLAKLYLGGLMLVLGLSTSATALLSSSPRALRAADRLAPFVCSAYAVFYFTFMITLGALKTQALHTYADLATHLEILWRASHGLGLTSAMSAELWTGPHWFAAHFTPIAYLLTVPLFKVVPGGLTLLTLQTIALMSAAVPVMLYARDRLGPRATCWAGLAFLLYPTLQYTNLYEFEYLRFSIPFLAWACYALHRGWTWLYVVMCALALLTREEVGLVVAALGLYAIFAKQRRRLGAMTAMAGLGMFALSVGAIIPSFRTGGGLVYDRFFAVPGGGQDGWRSVAPWIAAMVFDPIRFGNLVMLLLPFQFLSLAAPGVLFVALPNITSTFVSSSITHYSFFLYYLSPSVPFIAFAAIDGMQRARDWLCARPGWFTGGGDATQRATVSVAIFVVLGALASNVIFGPSPLSVQFWRHDYKVGEFHTTNFHRSSYIVTQHARAALAIADLVPPDAVVSAEQFFLPHLYNRRGIHVFPTLRPDVTHVLIDRRHPLKTGWGDTYLSFRRRPEYYYALVENDTTRWRVIAESDGVRLFGRR